MTSSCTACFTKHAYLKQHWAQRHAQAHGSLADYKGDAECCPSPLRADASQIEDSAPPDVVGVAMAHLDNMIYRHYATNSEAGRAREMARSLLDSIKPAIVAAVRPHMHETVDVSALVEPICRSLDQINSARLTSAERRVRSAQYHPPLQVYRRTLGERPAATGKRKYAEGGTAYAYDTKIDEVMERELAFDPQFATEIILTDNHWKTRSRQIREGGLRSPSRAFGDICDGQVWQDHPHLGNPDYVGVTRTAFLGYNDDVDVVPMNTPGSGHHTLFLSFLLCLSKPPGSRMTLRSLFLSTEFAWRLTSRFSVLVLC